MKKEDFIKLGLDEETAKKCEAASTEELKGFIPKTRFDEVNNEKKAAELTIQERDNQLETLKKSTGDVETLKKQIETLQADNKTKDETHAAEIKKLKIETAIETALTGAKAKNVKAVKALLDMGKIDVDKDGNVTGLEQISSLAKAEDSKFLFDTETKQTKFKGQSAGEGREGTPGTITKEDFAKYNYTQRLELYNNDRDQYDALTKEG